MISEKPLPQTDLFQSLPEEARNQLKSFFTLKKFQAGDVIIRQGSRETQYFYIVASGLVELFVDEEDGSRIHLASIGPGDYFGERALLVEEDSSCNVVAREDTEVYVLTREHFYQFLTAHPELSRHFVWTFTQRLHRTNLLLEEKEYKEAMIDLLSEEYKPYTEAIFIARSRAMRPVLEGIRRAASNSSPVLIEGEYGSGKQLLARQIHAKTARWRKAFILVDCGALMEEENREESLFGREHGQPFHLSEHAFGYLELAEGGTLFLKNIDQLSLEVQQRIREVVETGSYTRLGSTQVRKADFRLIASTRANLREKAAAGEFDSRLYGLLSANHIQLPPLRERKNAIPKLVDYFIKKYARLVNKNVTGATPEAMQALLKHDYKLGNIKELEQIIERAVALPSDDKIWPRHLFLGAPAVRPDSWYFNLLKIKPFGRWVMNKIYPDKLQYATATFFMLLILLCFLGPASAARNPAAFLVWRVWWPMMFLSFFWVGRTWCSICAYAAFGRKFQKLKQYQLPVPAFIRDHDALLVTLAFLTILWAEEITHMRSSPRATGWLMVTMLSLAMVSAVIFRRESWCRYLCPMGGLIGVCSMSSIIELRSDTTLCANQCKGAECYNGTPENPGCPLFQHLLFVDNNQNCKLCLQCIRNCPNHSASLNLRLPGREIWLSNQVRDKMSFFVCALLGSLVPVIYLEARNITLQGGRVKALYTLAHFLLPVIVAAILYIPGLLSSPGTKSLNWLRFWHTSYAYVPLALAAHLAHQMQFVPGGEYFQYLIRSRAGGIIQGPIVQPLQTMALISGLLFSWFCLWQIYQHRRQKKTFEAQWCFWLGHAFLMSLYAAMVFHLMVFR
ncbi:MAG: sigma 54-interacting transcriptional regulator [bacterium]